MAVSRHRSREMALHTLYRVDIEDKGSGDVIFEKGEKEEKGGMSAGQEDYGRVLVEGVTAHLADIDVLIEGSSEHWTVKRMAVVDRNILRIGVFEFMYRVDVPGKVVIDEAVELANRYGSEESGAFINGVLDKIFKDMLDSKASSRPLN